MKTGKNFLLIVLLACVLALAGCGSARNTTTLAEMREEVQKALTIMASA